MIAARFYFFIAWDVSKRAVTAQKSHVGMLFGVTHHAAQLKLAAIEPKAPDNQAAAVATERGDPCFPSIGIQPA